MNVLLYKPVEEVKEVCANSKCKVERLMKDLKKVIYKSKLGYYCRDCTNSIIKKCFCIYCKHVFLKDKGDNTRQWILCAEKGCENWSHLDCEETKGIRDIYELIKDEKYHFTCKKCKKKKSKNYIVEETPKILEIRASIFSQLKTYDRSKLEKVIKTLVKKFPNVFYFFNYSVIRLNLKRLDLDELELLNANLERYTQ